MYEVWREELCPLKDKFTFLNCQYKGNLWNWRILTEKV